ncbi:hypothetical protein ES703_10302 [subsurface metagenome]
MFNQQLEIPGMPPPSSPRPKKLSARQRIADLESRVFQLEVEVTLLRVRDKDHV